MQTTSLAPQPFDVATSEAREVNDGRERLLSRDSLMIYACLPHGP